MRAVDIDQRLRILVNEVRTGLQGFLGIAGPYPAQLVLLDEVQPGLLQTAGGLLAQVSHVILPLTIEVTDLQGTPASAQSRSSDFAELAINSLWSG